MDMKMNFLKVYSGHPPGISVCVSKIVIRTVLLSPRAAAVRIPILLPLFQDRVEGKLTESKKPDWVKPNRKKENPKKTGRKKNHAGKSRGFLIAWMKW